jgi:putrescine transport system substrate-binding protein
MTNRALLALLTAGALWACSPDPHDIHYANANLAANPYVDPHILNDPAVYTSVEVRSRLYRSAEVSPSLERLRTRTWTRIKTAR